MSPLKADKKRVSASDPDSESTDTDDHGFEAKKKGPGSSSKAATGKQGFREMVREKWAEIITTANKSNLKTQEGRKSHVNRNDLPQATVANKSETFRTTASNSVSASVVKASKPPAPKKKVLPKAKLDSITIKTGLSGDEDEKEQEDMLASPVKGLDA